MEYRLNKIDIDARRKIIEKTKSGKIHKGNKIERIKKYKEKNEKNLKKEKIEKRYLTINGENRKEKLLEVEGEIKLTRENSIGSILDKKG